MNVNNWKPIDHSLGVNMMNKLPEEILICILSFVSDKWLLNCALVCNSWRNVTLRQTFWRRKCLQTRRFIEKYMAPHYPEDWKSFYCKSPYTRNLIKNPSGRAGTRGGWVIVDNGGDGWRVETGTAGAGKKPAKLLSLNDGQEHHFATSYGWCRRFQVINLLEEGFSEAMLDSGQPTIEVSEWYAPRFDCGNVYQLTVQLHRSETGEDIPVDEFTHGPITAPQWAPTDWKEVKHTFSNYGPGVRYILYKDESKDTQFWAGHYGSKIAGSAVRLRFHSVEDDG